MQYLYYLLTQNSISFTECALLLVFQLYQESRTRFFWIFYKPVLKLFYQILKTGDTIFPLSVKLPAGVLSCNLKIL